MHFKKGFWIKKFSEGPNKKINKINIFENSKCSVLYPKFQKGVLLTKVLGKTKTGLGPCELGPAEEAVDKGIVASEGCSCRGFRRLSVQN